MCSRVTIASAKALRQECAPGVQGRVQRPWDWGRGAGQWLCGSNTEWPSQVPGTPTYFPECTCSDNTREGLLFSLICC